MDKKSRAKKIMTLLAKEFPNAKTALNYSKDYELLFAVMMSAQSTDVSVNKLTQNLYKKYNTLEKFAAVDLSKFEKEIKSINYYKTKAKNLKATATKLLEEFGGKVPNSQNELTSLPGVGRKTANVILSEYFGINEGFVVDTHVARTARRCKLTNHTDPKKIELDLMKLFPQSEWRQISLGMIYHGRTTCPARRKKETPCSLGDLCEA